MTEQQSPKPLPRLRKLKHASAALGIAFHKLYERLVDAPDENEAVVVTVEMATLFNDNLEFIIWALKKQGGLEPPNPEEIRRERRPGILPVLPPMMSGTPANDLKCTCEVLEHGIIGRDKHMTSCPKFIPTVN